MDFKQGGAKPARNFTGIALVVLLHALLIYALVTGLARKIVAVIQKPVETKIIEEFKPPPPLDKLVPPPPKLVAPPPPFVPSPEVKVQQVPQENVIAAVTNIKPVNNELSTTTAPIASIATTTATAPTAPIHTAAVVSAKGCEKPEYPSASLRNEEEGIVTLAFLIGIDGTVVDSKVEKSSGFRDLDKAARSGLSLCKFKPATTDGKPEQSWTKIQYAWKLD